MTAWYTRQLEARRGLPWWLPLTACLLCGVALWLVSRSFYGQVPGGERLIISVLLNEILARGGFLIWAGAVFGLVAGLDSGFLKVLFLSYWVLLVWALLATLFALLFAPTIQLPNIAGHELNSSDVEDAFRQLQTSVAYQTVRLTASVATLGQVWLAWVGLQAAGVSKGDARTAALIALGVGVFLKVLGLV